MRNLERIKLEDGSEILVEVMESGETAVSGVVDDLHIDQILRQVSSLAVKLRAIADTVRPDEATVEVGIGFAVESGALTAVIMKGSAEGNIKVSFTWKKKPDN